MLVPLYKRADKGWVQERLDLERNFQLQQVIEMEKEQKEEVGFAWGSNPLRKFTQKSNALSAVSANFCAQFVEQKMKALCFVWSVLGKRKRGKR